jgi:hypothetical protein
MGAELAARADLGTCEDGLTRSKQRKHKTKFKRFGRGRPSTALRVNSKRVPTATVRVRAAQALRNFDDHAGGSGELRGVPAAAEGLDELDAGGDLLRA